jgi:nucleoside-diphosphate-sugar epimerase
MLQDAKAPIVLVTGAAGGIAGATGRVLTHLLLDRRVQVRALVRSEDDRAASLRAAGAEVPLSMPSRDIQSLSCSHQAPNVSDGLLLTLAMT